MSRRKMHKKRDSSKYFREPECIEIKIISHGNVIDTQGFKKNNVNDTIRLFEFLCDKHDFNYKEYQKFKNIKWQ